MKGPFHYSTFFFFGKSGAGTFPQLTTEMVLKQTVKRVNSLLRMDRCIASLEVLTNMA